MFVNTFKKLALLFALVCLIIPFSCQSSNHTGNDTAADSYINQQEREDSALADAHSTADIMPLFSAEYTPLTLDKLQAVRNGTDEFKEIAIFYSSSPGKLGPDSISNLALRAGLGYKAQDYTMISEYNGTFANLEPTGKHNIAMVETFTKAEVDLILDYIENNSAYFFNHEEYDGADEVLSRSRHLCHDNYKFTISIDKPDIVPGAEYRYAWGISKCVDEYPAPDHPLYALFEMLEDDFISQFDENNLARPFDT